MELLRFGVLALMLRLAVAGSDATSSRSAKEHWHSIWPHTSFPKNLEYLLGSGMNDAENKDTQYPNNSFFEDDLHAGKQMNIIFNTPDAKEEKKSNAMDKDLEKLSPTQPWGVGQWKRKTVDKDSEKSSPNQPWGVGQLKRKVVDEDLEKSFPTQPWGVGQWKKNTIDEDLEKSSSTQPWGVGQWKKHAVDEDTKKSSPNQPWGVGQWKRNIVDEDSKKSSPTQPWGVGQWKRNAMDEDSEKSSPTQPWGVGQWKRKMLDEDSKKSSPNQPWGVGQWKRNVVDEDSKSSPTQPWGVGQWKKSMVDEDPDKSWPTQPWGVGQWKRNAVHKDIEKSSPTQPWGVGQWKRKAMVNDPNNLSLEAICNAKERFVGEDDKFCAKSVESLLDFAISKLGKDIEALSSSFVPLQTQYTILEGIQRVSSEGVMCHKLNFDKPVFYCHQVNATTTYIVPMEAADGTRTSVVALCHRDTRGLDPHKLFHQLKVMPGTEPVCHFLGSGAISWVPRNNELRAAY